MEIIHVIYFLKSEDKKISVRQFGNPIEDQQGCQFFSNCRTVYIFVVTIEHLLLFFFGGGVRWDTVLMNGTSKYNQNMYLQCYIIKIA